MRTKGISNYVLDLRQAPPRYFIQNYLEFGKLKEFKLVENDALLGREERVFKLNTDMAEGQNVKNILLELFDTFSSSNEKIPFLNKGEYDEITFVLGVNGSTKTFYVKNHERIRSNIDVSNLIEYSDGQPTTESLIKVSLDIIKQAS